MRVWTLLSLLVISACVSLSKESRNTFDRSGLNTECPQLHIENLGWDDVTVYMGNAAVGKVTGLQERTINICRFVGRRVEFRVRPLAGRAYAVPYSGARTLDRHDNIRLQIGVRPEYSFAIPWPVPKEGK